MKKFELMALPYAIDALEPVISRQTLEFHQLAPHRKTIRVKSVIRPLQGRFLSVPDIRRVDRIDSQGRAPGLGY